MSNFMNYIINHILNLLIKIICDIDEDGIRDWYQDSDRNWSSQTIRLTLEYRFGKMEDRSRYSRQRGDRDGGMDMDSGNMEID